MMMTALFRQEFPFLHSTASQLHVRSVGRTVGLFFAIIADKVSLRKVRRHNKFIVNMCLTFAGKGTRARVTDRHLSEI